MMKPFFSIITLSELLSIYMYFQEYFANFDRDFGMFDESGTYYEGEAHNFSPKLNLTLSVLLRKVSILY